MSSVPFSWKEKIQILHIMVKDISDGYGGDNEAWLKEYCMELIEKDWDKIVIAIKSIYVPRVDENNERWIGNN